MIENSKAIKEKVFVIEPIFEDKTLNNEDLINEINSLITSANAEPSGFIVVKIREITPATFIGKGKLQEIKEWLDLNPVDTVVFDGVLSPSQTLNMSDRLGGVKVIDRTTLILDIFALSAKTHEGKLQVELAQLNYLYPRLKGKGEALSRLGGGIGTRGPGETQLETDRRHIRERIDNLKKELELLEGRRKLQAERRKKNAEITISLVGYTNSGKSTLLNLLTNSNVLAENRLFATLDPTIRKCKIGDFEVLLVDTVGFIRNIPTEIIEAFKSTLESAKYSDVNLIVCDGSSDYMEEQLNVTTKILNELDVKSNIITVINKCDVVESCEHFPNNAVCISAKNNQGIDNLINKIQEVLADTFVKTKLTINYNEIGEFTKNVDYLESYTMEYTDENVLVDVVVKKVYFGKFAKFKK